MNKVENNKLISFEFFPPKTSEGIANLDKTAQTLARLNPHFFSVTYGAGGSTRTHTLEIVKQLKESTGIEIAPHLSCIELRSDEISDLLINYQALKIQRLVALRGDLPANRAYQVGEFQYAEQLVKFIRQQTGNWFHIAVAAYPESHPQVKNAYENIIHFKKKIDAGADSAITQFFFNSDAYFYFVDQCSKAGVNVPIVPGIMPITHVERLIRFAAQCGAEIPRWILKQFESYYDVASIEAFGLEVIYKLCYTLLKGGAPGLHFYTLNQLDASLTITNALGF